MSPDVNERILRAIKEGDADQDVKTFLLRMLGMELENIGKQWQYMDLYERELVETVRRRVDPPK